VRHGNTLSAARKAYLANGADDIEIGVDADVRGGDAHRPSRRPSWPSWPSRPSWPSWPSWPSRASRRTECPPTVDRKRRGFLIFDGHSLRLVPTQPSASRIVPAARDAEGYDVTRPNRVTMAQRHRGLRVPGLELCRGSKRAIPCDQREARPRALDRTKPSLDELQPRAPSARARAEMVCACSLPEGIATLAEAFVGAGRAGGAAAHLRAGENLHPAPSAGNGADEAEPRRDLVARPTSSPPNKASEARHAAARTKFEHRLTRARAAGARVGDSQSGRAGPQFSEEEMQSNPN
jgi:hypothetical protein